MIFNRFVFCYFIIAAITVSCAEELCAQNYRITGKVTEAVTGEPLAFVNVYLLGETIGTTTDFDGYYTLFSNRHADSISASSLGFQKVTKFFPDKAEQNINFVLERASFNLAEIVILPGENPAHVILRNVIANKEKNSNKIQDNYRYEAYNKVELDLYNWNEKFENRKVMKPFQFVFEQVDSFSEDKPFLPVFLSESLSDYYYKSDPEKEREVIKASKISGMENESISQFMGSLYQQVSVYENWPVLFLKSFVSPIADVGLTYYKYYLVDSGYIEGQWCYKLNFVPKGQGSFTFIGDLWITDSSWAIKRASMQVADHVNINFIDKISLHQEFVSVADTNWMLSKDKIVVRFKVTEKNLGIIGRKTAMYRDFVINDPGIEEFFTTRSEIEVDKNAFKKDEEYWEEQRHEELSNNEVAVYDLVDSLRNTRAFRTWVDIVNLVFSGYYEVGKFGFGPYASLYSYNQIEHHRFRLGIRTTEKMSKIMQFMIYGAYGLEDNRFKWGGSALFLITKNPRQSIKLNYKHDLDLSARNPADFGQENLLTGLARRRVPQKLNFLDQISLYYEKEWRVGYSSRITLQHVRIAPYDVPTYRFRYLPPDDDTPPDTLRTITTAEISLRGRFAYHEKFLSGDFSRVSLGSKYPILILEYTAGIKGIVGSEYNYHRLDFFIRDEIPINPIGTFYWYLLVGKVFGTVPYLLARIHQGNETYFFNTYAFNLMNEYEFASDLYAELILRLHFEGYFLNKIPGIRKLKWRELINAKAVIGTMSKENKIANGLNEFTVPYPIPYVEVGAGIENIFKFFEVDFIYRVTYRDQPWTDNWGFRFGLKVDF